MNPFSFYSCDTVDRNTTIQVGTATDWQTVTAGVYPTLATKTTGSLWFWGSNVASQLGLGDMFTNLNGISTNHKLIKQ